MPRPPRIYVEGALYYVTSRGVHNQQIFATSSDYKEYIDLIAEYKKQLGFKLFAYTLLPTHIHMLIELKNNIPISNIIRDVNSRYTKTFNRRYSKTGNLFQTRFKAVVAEKETYLLPLARHILLNSRRLETAENPEVPNRSNLTQFLEPVKKRYPDVTREIEEVFSSLKGREEAFSKYVFSVGKEGLRKFKKSINKKRVLGSDDFIARIEGVIEQTKQ